MEATAERKEGAGYPENLDSLRLVRESSARPRLLAGPPFRSTLAENSLQPSIPYRKVKVQELFQGNMEWSSLVSLLLLIRSIPLLRMRYGCFFGCMCVCPEDLWLKTPEVKCGCFCGCFEDY